MVSLLFAQLSHALQLAGFLGHNEKAVRWQVWTALLAYVLLRFSAYAGYWAHAFARLFALLRGRSWRADV
jgi:hypothetical protein